MGYVLDGIDATIAKLDDKVPLIGFSGAPFTLAGYMVEGKPSRELERTKEMMYRQPEAWHLLMAKLTRMVCDYLASQVSHGVDAVQLFDSWVGCLSPEDYRTYVSRYTKEIMSSVDGRVPRIHFCANSAHLLEDFVETGADVLSVDWRVPLAGAWAASAGRVGIQGNLDPVLALSGGDAMLARRPRTLDRVQGAERPRVQPRAWRAQGDAAGAPEEHSPDGARDHRAEELSGVEDEQEEEMSKEESVCVVLMTYGSPATLDDIPGYLRNIRGGRDPDDALVAEFRRRYELIGGSPLICDHSTLRPPRWKRS